MKVVEIQKLTKAFSLGFGKTPLKALDGLSFSLEKGQVLGVVGPNGSGKTTLFKCILGFIKATSGTIHLFENRLSEMELKSKIGFLQEKVNYYSELTPVELLKFYGSFYSIPSQMLKEKINELLKLVDLDAFRNIKVRNFSKGMLQRVGIASSLISDSEFLIFDEPASGLDLFGIAQIKNIMKKLSQQGKTLMISSHVLSHIQDICDEFVVLYKGRLIKAGNWNELMENRECFQIELKINSISEGEKAAALLTRSGYQVEHASWARQDLEKIFMTIIGEHQ
ncbi:MAG: ABC transporter ATP-binding protein [Candidatus Aureabacteria bacterium]|nr:ABC transporter ATP-binding protein [Candidatus Auribacterota bacterium]